MRNKDWEILAKKMMEHVKSIHMRITIKVSGQAHLTEKRHKSQSFVHNFHHRDMLIQNKLKSSSQKSKPNNENHNYMNKNEKLMKTQLEKLIQKIKLD